MYRRALQAGLPQRNPSSLPCLPCVEGGLPAGLEGGRPPSTQSLNAIPQQQHSASPYTPNPSTPSLKTHTISNQVIMHAHTSARRGTCRILVRLCHTSIFREVEQAQSMQAWSVRASVSLLFCLPSSLVVSPSPSFLVSVFLLCLPVSVCTSVY